jgi:hypothetical protein
MVLKGFTAVLVGLWLFYKLFQCRFFIAGVRRDSNDLRLYYAGGALTARRFSVICMHACCPRSKTLSLCH